MSTLAGKATSSPATLAIKNLKAPEFLITFAHAEPRRSKWSRREPELEESTVSCPAQIAVPKQASEQTTIYHLQSAAHLGLGQLLGDQQLLKEFKLSQSETRLKAADSKSM